MKPSERVTLPILQAFARKDAFSRFVSGMKRERESQVTFAAMNALTS